MVTKKEKITPKEIVEQKTTEMYRNVRLIQDELGKIEVAGKSDNNLVKLTLNGQHQIKDLSINPALLKESNKIVEALIISAYNNAKDKMEEEVKSKMLEAAKALGFFEEPEEPSEESLA